MDVTCFQVEVEESEPRIVVVGGGAAGHTAVETLRYCSVLFSIVRYLKILYFIYRYFNVLKSTNLLLAQHWIVNKFLCPGRRVSEVQSPWCVRSRYIIIY